MSEIKAGNLAAIRDWGDHYFYDKSEVAEFFTKLNDGLTAYKLTIIGDDDTQTITIIEDAQTNPQTYIIKTINGEYNGVFFFHSGSTISLYDNGVLYNEHILNDYVDIIYLRPLVSAIPVMTSNTTPSGTGVASASGEMWYSGNNYAAWRAMQQIEHPSINWVDPNNSINAWIQFKFDAPTKIRKAKISLPGWKWGNRFPSSYKLNASNDGTNWDTLIDKEHVYTCPSTSTPSKSYVSPTTDIFNLKGNIAYSYYRILFGKTPGGGTHLDEMTLYRMADPPAQGD